MPASTPGASSRGRGGKWKKYTRGGGRHFSRDLQPADDEGNKVSMWSANARHGSDDDDEDDSSEEDSSEEDSDDEAAKGGAAAAQSRDDRKAQKKARKEAAIARQKGQNVQVGDLPSSDEEDESDADMPANPNHSRAARNQTARPKEVEEITEGVSKIAVPGNRKEREALEAQASKERYMKLQAEGKTDQAKADLARLKLIREQRAAEASRREAEKEEKDAQDAARKAEIEAREKKLREAAAGPKKSKKK